MLVFEKESAPGAGEGRQPRPDLVYRNSRGDIGMVSESTVDAPPLEAMHPSSRPAPRPEKPIEFGKRAAADQRQGAAALGP
jgi:hypothetical protein